MTNEIDRAAAFLLELHWPNAFEQRHDGYWRCKVCDETVKSQDRQKHFAHDKQRNSTQKWKEIQNMASTKTKKQTARDQGIPEVYLGENGNFKPGYDASLKRDLIAAIDGLDNPKALHQFDATEAAKILAARGWNGFLVKSRNAREVKAARAANAAKTKAAKTKAAVAKKAETRSLRDVISKDAEVKADPKPTRTRRAGTRKVGA